MEEGKRVTTVRIHFFKPLDKTFNSIFNLQKTLITGVDLHSDKQEYTSTDLNRTRQAIRHSPLMLLPASEVPEAAVAHAALVRALARVPHHMAPEFHVQNARVPTHTGQSDDLKVCFRLATNISLLLTDE